MQSEMPFDQIRGLRREASKKRERAERELAKAEKSLADAQKDEAALDRTLELLGVSKDSRANEVSAGTTLESQGTAKNRPPNSRKVKITEEVRNALQEFEGEFTPHDIAAWIEQRHPLIEVRPATVSSTLWRMADRGKDIEKVREGSGSKPNHYRKIPHHGSMREGFVEEERNLSEETHMS